MAGALIKLIQDPPPDYVFELSEGGIAYVRPGTPTPAFEPLEPGIIVPSPITDNVLKADALADIVRALASNPSGRKSGRAVLILPDYCARVAVLEFDTFPTDPKEQQSLVRFRMKRSVPFDVESAVISYHPQHTKTKTTEVIVVAAALEIVSRYEAPFRAAGLHPGMVTTSSLAMLDLERRSDISVISRMSGRVLTVIVQQAGMVKLVRTVELPEVIHEEIMGVLFPTLAFVEDHYQSQPARVLFCGMGELGGWEQELGVPVETLHSRFGTPNQFNAGLHGYLQSMTSASAGASAA
jgi:type IV pilus assembly protein PilM